MSGLPTLPGWLDLELGLLLATTLFAFATVFGLLNVLGGRDPLAERIRTVSHRRPSRLRTTAGPRETGKKNEAMSQIMRRTVERLNLMRSQQATKIADHLARAGWRRPDAVVVYLFCKVCMPFVFGGIAAIFLMGFGLFNLSPRTQLVISLASILLGSYAPELYIRNAATKRANEIRKVMPDALDLLVVCTEAGLALDAALDRVAREIGASSAAMADELSHTVLELRFMPERRKALERLARRSEVPGIQALVNTLIQTERFGTPLGQSLRVLSAEMRTQRLVRAEEKAARLPAIMTIPLIVFILPTLFVVLMGPAILDMIDMFAGL